MRLVRITSRFGGLPDLYTFECRACGVSRIEARHQRIIGPARRTSAYGRPPWQLAIARGDRWREGLMSSRAALQRPSASQRIHADADGWRSGVGSYLPVELPDKYEISINWNFELLVLSENHIRA
jgi:hypothetical protein